MPKVKSKSKVKKPSSDPWSSIKAFLEDPGLPWCPELTTMETYARVQDDHDGTYEGCLQVVIDQQGDVHMLNGFSQRGSIRFRTSAGGGMSQRVRTALLILAHAIQLDNEAAPIHISPEKSQ